MPSLSVIVDTPDTVTLAGDRAVSQVQIAKTGAFKDPRYGTFKITLADFSKWIANFSQLNKSEDRLGLPVDVDHAPETRGDTEAAGWITNLSIKGNELWATVEWNDLGKELVGNRRYAYLSPSYVAHFKDEQGKDHGTALLGVALTNRPFLTMATVSLSKAQYAEEVADTTSNEQEMPELKNIAEKLGLAADADEATILSKLAEVTAPKPEPTVKTLASMAAAEGMVVLSTEQHDSLTSNATKGADAAKQLSQMRFEGAFDKALAAGRVLPAQKETMLSFYEMDADKTLSMIEDLPQVVNTTPIGSGGGNDANVGAQLSVDMRETEYGTPDEDRIKLHNRAVQLESEQKLSYGDAIVAAAQELGL